MPLPTRTLADDEQEHLDDHNDTIKPVIDAYENTGPSDFATANHSHSATATSFTAGGTIAATNVQTAVTEVATDAASALTAHTTDAIDAHDATAVSITAVGDVVENNVQDAIENLDQRITGVTAISSPLGVPFSSFAGANDDARLVAYNAARLTAGSGLHGHPVLLDQSRVYTFAAGLTISSGFAVIGSLRNGDQARSSKPIGTQVNLRRTSAGGWLVLPNGDTFGVELSGISFDANANSRVIQPNGSAVLWTSRLKDIGYQNGPGVIGSSTQYQPCDVLTIEGWCNWNNILDRGHNIGGSDNAINCTKFTVDSNPDTAMGPTGYLMQFNSMSKTDVSGYYMTCWRHSGILIAGSNQMLTFTRCFIEGRNDGSGGGQPAPCYGALVRISSSFTQWDKCWLSYAMTNPALGANTGDLGYVHCTNGHHEFLNCHTRLADANTAASTYMVYATGANTHIVVRNAVGEGNTSVAGQTDGLPFKPRIRVVGGATYDVDSSVTVVTS